MFKQTPDPGHKRAPCTCLTPLSTLLCQQFSSLDSWDPPLHQILEPYLIIRLHSCDKTFQFFPKSTVLYYIISCQSFYSSLPISMQDVQNSIIDIKIVGHGINETRLTVSYIKNLNVFGRRYCLFILHYCHWFHIYIPKPCRIWSRVLFKNDFLCRGSKDEEVYTCTINCLDSRFL